MMECWAQSYTDTLYCGLYTKLLLLTSMSTSEDNAPQHPPSLYPLHALSSVTFLELKFLEELPLLRSCWNLCRAQGDWHFTDTDAEIAHGTAGAAGPSSPTCPVPAHLHYLWSDWSRNLSLNQLRALVPGGAPGKGCPFPGFCTWNKKA